MNDGSGPHDIDRITGHTNVEAGAHVMATEIAVGALAEHYGQTRERLAAMLLVALRNGQLDGLVKQLHAAVDHGLPMARELAVEAMKENTSHD